LMLNRTVARFGVSIVIAFLPAESHNIPPRASRNPRSRSFSILIVKPTQRKPPGLTSLPANQIVIEKARLRQWTASACALSG
jgi:hypothetical protein